MTNKQKYYALVAELEALESSLYAEYGRVYLSDQCVDRENVDASLIEGSDEYYASLTFCAQNAAGMRAEELGLNINKLLGRDIY